MEDRKSELRTGFYDRRNERLSNAGFHRKTGNRHQLQRRRKHRGYQQRYRRTKKRDREYERIFWERKQINGKRIPSTMYARTYVD